MTKDTTDEEKTDGSRPKVVLIDAFSLIHRAFYALPPMNTSTGEPTNAVLGFANMLLALLDDENPAYVAVAFDRSGPTFRDEMYDEYKANRAPMPDDLRPQIAHTEAFLEAMNVPVYGEAGFEADDIIGTLAKQAAAENMDVLIVTGDRDLLQLVDDNIQVLITRRGIRDMDRMDAAAVKELLGVGPELVTDLKGLMGDNSDNIPGVPRVGPKTALRLLEQFGSLEEVLSNAREVRGQVGENLRTYEEQARLSKQLSVIRTDAPARFDADAMRIELPDMEKVTELTGRLEMRTLLERIQKRVQDEGGSAGVEGDDDESGLPVEIILDENSLEAAVADLTTRLADNPSDSNAQALVVDAVIDGDDGMRAPFVGLFLASAEQGYYIPLSTDDEDEGSRLPWETVRAAVHSLLTDADVPKWCADVKRLRTVLRHHDSDLIGTTIDVTLASYLINPEGNHQLADAAMRHLDRFVPTWTQRLRDKGVGRRAARVVDVSAEDVAAFVAEDAAALFELAPVLMDRLAKDELLDLYKGVELPLAHVLLRAEQRGVRLDLPYLAELAAEMDEQVEALTASIYEAAGTEFNVNSPRQLGTVLFEEMGLPVVKRTKTGPSTDQEVLETLAEEHEIAGMLLDYRQVTKLKSTYVDALPALVHPETGRVHTNFNQTVTATGRLSSTHPNLQNIPVRTPEGRRIRKAFIPSEPDWVMMKADYSQIELRILAHISEDEVLIDAFRQGQDIHTRTAAEVFEVAQEDITEAQREAAKAINFGIVYGISSFGLARGTGLTRADAQKYIDEYFDRYPGVKQYIDAIKELGKEQGYVTTLLNRRRYLPELRSRNWARRSFAERTAMNTPIQGTAADIIKMAMVAADEQLQRAGLQARLLLQVHDELVLELPEEEVERAASIIAESMSGVIELAVPLVVDIESGPNWLETKPVVVRA